MQFRQTNNSLTAFHRKAGAFRKCSTAV